MDWWLPSSRRSDGGFEQSRPSRPSLLGGWLAAEPWSSWVTQRLIRLCSACQRLTWLRNVHNCSPFCLGVQCVLAYRFHSTGYAQLFFSRFAHTSNLFTLRHAIKESSILETWVTAIWQQWCCSLKHSGHINEAWSLNQNGEIIKNE